MIKKLWRKYRLWLAKRRLFRAAKLIESAGYIVLDDPDLFFEERWRILRAAYANCDHVLELRRVIAELEETIR